MNLLYIAFCDEMALFRDTDIKYLMLNITVVLGAFIKITKIIHYLTSFWNLGLLLPNYLIPVWYLDLSLPYYLITVRNMDLSLLSYLIFVWYQDIVQFLWIFSLKAPIFYNLSNLCSKHVLSNWNKNKLRITITGMLKS